MKILISPAKGFKDSKKEATSLPPLIDKTIELNNILKKKNIDDLKNILKVKDDIAQLNVDRFKNMKFDLKGRPAIFTYDGLQFKNMSLDDFDDEEIEFCNNNTLIMSGFYGVLRPMDSIYPHRLDFLTKFKTEEYKNLYDFWKSDIADIILKSVNKDDVILNLSSNEFLKSISSYIPKNMIINCVFKVVKNDKAVVHSTASKQARGQMLNFIVKNRITDLDEIKKFNIDGYAFNEYESDANNYVFIKK